MTNINAFVLQDFWGAGVFHLLAGLIIAAVLGATTAAITTRLGAADARRVASRRSAGAARPEARSHR